MDHKRDKIGVFVSTVSTKIPFKVGDCCSSVFKMLLEGLQLPCGKGLALAPLQTLPHPTVIPTTLCITQRRAYSAFAPFRPHTPFLGQVSGMGLTSRFPFGIVVGLKSWGCRKLKKEYITHQVFLVPAPYSYVATGQKRITPNKMYFKLRKEERSSHRASSRANNTY